MVNEKATKFRETRDEWNKKSKTHSTARNELNAEVKEAPFKLRTADIREQMNEIVRDKKVIRQDANKKVKEVKSRIEALRGPTEQITEASEANDLSPHQLKRELERLKENLNKEDILAKMKKGHEAYERN